MGPNHATSILRACALIAAISVALLATAFAGAATAAAAPGEIAAIDADGARSYWTGERMRSAEPLAPVATGEPPAAGAPAPPSPDSPAVVAPVEAGAAPTPQLERGLADPAASERGTGYTRTEITDPSAAGVRMQGKVFLTVNGGSAPGDYVCSGTAISSNNGSVVWSAGHCVFDTEGGGYASNWMFVPGYKNGAAPFGKWPAVKLASPEDWRQGANSSYDFSAAKVAKNGAGETLNQVVGGRGIGFNQPRTQQYTSYGYPAQQPPLEFTGGREFACQSGLGGTDNPPGSGPNTDWIGCDMTGGSSGGGWIANGTLLSVNSYSYCTVLLCEERLYGPYLDDTAKQLYKQIAGEAEYCQDKKVTILGTAGTDYLQGTGGKDVIDGLGGRDHIDGKGGKDVVCGGGDNDEIEGKGGKDKLDGDDGDDRLKGGDGKDACSGGAGHDSAKSCETEKKIP